MPKFKIAHIKEQGQDIIIVPLDESFDRQTEMHQESFLNEIRSAAALAGLRGVVVPIWPSYGNIKFIAPLPWHAFFKSITLDRVYKILNRELSW